MSIHLARDVIGQRVAAVIRFCSPARLLAWRTLVAPTKAGRSKLKNRHGVVVGRTRSIAAYSVNPGPNAIATM